jgi:hypothetical protein
VKFFRRKSDKPPAKSANAAHEAGGTAAGAPVTHRLTKELARAESLALMLAMSRAAAVVDVADYLAGIYIYDWERLSKFWDSQDAIGQYLQGICRISPQRWHHWIEFYDKERREENRRGRKFFASTKDLAPDSRTLSQSRELQSILRRAEAIAPHNDTFEGRRIPILTTECVLLSIARDEDSEIGAKLRETGLDVARLEQAARNPRHAPLHGENVE